jgi:Domain of unknown function (DUF4349)
MARISMHRGLVACVLLVSLLAAACGGSASAPLDTIGKSVDGGATGGGPVPAAASGAPGDQRVGANGQGTSGGNGNGAFKDDAKIVRTGSLSLQVKELDAAVAAGRDQVRTLGGYIGASRQTNDGDRSVATITYRIPSDRWEEALTALRKLGKLLDEQTNAIEVTGQLIDLGARIDNLRASETSLQAIARQATKVSDVLEVQNRLSEVRGQIEQLEAQRTHLSDQASLGTLEVTYGLEVAAVAEASKGWDPSGEVDRASATLIDVLQSLTSAGIWFAIVWLPILLSLAIVAVIANVVIRRTGILRRPSAQPPVYPTDA